nr:MAG TPA: hypothetical protein [Caudoviricetes sp.]
MPQLVEAWSLVRFLALWWVLARTGRSGLLLAARGMW